MYKMVCNAYYKCIHCSKYEILQNLTLAYTYLTNLASVLVTDLNPVGSATGARGTELYTLIIFRVDTHEILLVTLRKKEMK
jgi:hypothetical protein